ncbi:MAG TPA: tetratricopeptide repeat protein [Mucilaginibacter sp.]|jgi:antitoxin component YwqK of YwqJK toxin-antitoxin module/Tfp pilus assembly protein PilF|nr:tetratricopeptide repeat protein [Mucilaginibacter sp.]
MKYLKLLLVLLVLYPKLSSAQKFELVNSGDIIKQCAVLYDSGKYKQALDLNKINRSDTNYVWSLYEKAISCEADSQYTQAVKYCEEGLALKEQREWEPELYNTYGNSLMDLKQRDKARTVFDQAIAKYPSYALFYFNKGVTFMGESRWAEAETWFQKSLMISPYMYSAHYQLGLAALNQGKIIPAYLSFVAYLLMTPDGKYWSKSIHYINEISRATDEILDFKNKRTISPDANYQAVEDIVLSKIALDPAYKSVVSLDDPMARQIQAAFEKLEYSDASNDFWIQYYLPYYKQVFSNNNKFELFVYHIFSNVNVAVVQDYIKKNKKPMDAFVNEAATYFNLLRSTRELYYKKRDTVNQQYLFENGKLAGKGMLSDNGKLPVGHWVIFYPAGNVQAVGDCNSSGQREGEWLAYFDSGKLRARVHYKMGKLEGKQEYYFENGNLSSTENYSGDKPDGLVTAYFYAGYVKSTTNYKLGKKDGEVREYHSNGNLASVANYTAGVQNGEAREYYKNGLIKNIEMYVNDKGEGPYKGYFENGGLSSEGQQSKDKSIGEWKFYYENGKVKETRNYANDNENGLHQEFFDNGQLLCTYNVKKGKIEGEADYYYKDGKLLAKYAYDGGAIKSAAYFEKSGAQLSSSTLGDTSIGIIVYSRAGFKRAHPFYDKKGNLSGPDTLFYPSGKIDEINTYKDDDFNGPAVTFYPNGNKKSDANMTDGKEDGYVTTYYVNGKKEAEGWVKDGDDEGEWLLYDERGRLTTREYYLNNDLDGYKEEYNPKGQKTLEEKYYRGWLEKLTQYDDAGNIIAVDSFPKGSGKYVLYYPNKQKMTEGNYVNGDFDGAYKTYFFDGSPETSTFYKRGLLDSTYRSFFYGGIKDWEGQYLRGNKTGLWKSYEEDGSLSETYTYLNDELNGEKTFYFPEGSKDYVGEYKDDQLNGDTKKYDPDGTLMYQNTFEDDRAQYYTYLGKDGKPVPAIQLPYTNGIMKAYYPNGKPSREVAYTNGAITGRDLLYYTNGQLRSVDTTQYGISQGLSLEYYPNGKMKSQYHYVDDNADGICKDFYDTGILKKEITLENGVRNGASKYYDKNGKLVRTIIYNYGNIISVKNE